MTTGAAFRVRARFSFCSPLSLSYRSTDCLSNMERRERSEKDPFHPFETRRSGLTRKAVSAFCSSAPSRLPAAGGLFGASLALVAGLPAAFPCACRQQAMTSTPRPEGEDFDAALVLSGRHRGQNEAWIAEAIERVKAGGLIVVAGSTDDGIQAAQAVREDRRAGWPSAEIPRRRLLVPPPGRRRAP